jgi:DNA (cytosine-5)-methyltransferase 1
LVWENVPGVLSSNKGRDFAAFLGGLAECGYGFAYRVLDAQHFGVPQRRRRVVLVGYLGDWRPAAAVLFERESLLRDLTPRRETGQEVASYTPSSIGGYSEGIGTLRANGGDLGGGSETLVASTGDLAHCLNAGGMGRQDYETETLITHTLRGEGFDASEDGTGRGVPLVPVRQPIPIHDKATRHKGGGDNRNDDGSSNGLGIGQPGDPMPTMDTSARHAVAYDLRGREHGVQFEGPHDTANIRAASGGSSRSYVAAMQVRRLTPRECERLQGFPDDYTLIPHRGKPAADGPRYKALGNSWAVPKFRWLGERIQMVDDLLREAGRL